MRRLFFLPFLVACVSEDPPSQPLFPRDAGSDGGETGACEDAERRCSPPCSSLLSCYRACKGAPPADFETCVDVCGTFEAEAFIEAMVVLEACERSP